MILPAREALQLLQGTTVLERINSPKAVKGLIQVQIYKIFLKIYTEIPEILVLNLEINFFFNLIFLVLSKNTGMFD